MTTPNGPAVDDQGWVLSDAWVLSTIRVTGTALAPATLLDLISAADTVHHLILGRYEIEHAMGRLLAAGLVSVDDRGFAVMPAGRALVAQARGGKVVTRMEALLRILSRIDVTPFAWALDKREYEAACLDHQHSVWATYRRQGRQSRF